MSSLKWGSSSMGLVSWWGRLLGRLLSLPTHRAKTVWGHREKAATNKLGREACPKTNSADTLTLDFQNCEKNKCCLSHPFCGILLWMPEQTKTMGENNHLYKTHHLNTKQTKSGMLLNDGWTVRKEYPLTLTLEQVPSGSTGLLIQGHVALVVGPGTSLVLLGIAFP